MQLTYLKALWLIDLISDQKQYSVICDLLAAPPLRNLGWNKTYQVIQILILMFPFTSPRKTLQQSTQVQVPYKLINTDTADPLPPIQPPSTVGEIKYIVFKSSLMELFWKCISCCNVCICEVAYHKGVFVATVENKFAHTVVISSCGKVNPTSRIHQQGTSCFLFSGATPGKIFRLLDHMQVACISDRTF